MAGLVYFEGGPLDGHAYETEALLSSEGLPVPITDYMWTSEKKTSERTGNVAQIWRHVSLRDQQPTNTAPATVTPIAPAPPTPQPEAQAPATVTGVAGPNDATRVDAPATPSEPVQDVVVPANGVTAQDATTQPAANGSGALPSGADLLARRKALKLGRAEVSEKSGLAQSKIASIEAGTGKRIKDEEVRALDSALTFFEQQAVGSGASAHS